MSETKFDPAKWSISMMHVATIAFACFWIGGKIDHLTAVAEHVWTVQDQVNYSAQLQIINADKKLLTPDPIAIHSANQ